MNNSTVSQVESTIVVGLLALLKRAILSLCFLSVNRFLLHLLIFYINFVLQQNMGLKKLQGNNLTYLLSLTIFGVLFLVVNLQFLGLFLDNVKEINIHPINTEYSIINLQGFVMRIVAISTIKIF